MNVRLMSDLDLQGKTVVFREDLNVPVKEGKITSDKRIRAAIPSLRFALDKGAGIIVLSHLGRPEEGVYSEEASLAPVAKRLEELLGVPVRLEKDYLDGVSVKPGECVLCENVRFNKGEKKNNEEVAPSWPRSATCTSWMRSPRRTARRLPPKGPSVSPRSPAWVCSWPPNSKP